MAVQVTDAASLCAVFERPLWSSFHPRAAEQFRATGGRTGGLRQDWQGAFVVTHIDRAGPIVQGAHWTTGLLTTAAR